MSLVAFELPSQMQEALEVFRQRRHVLIYSVNVNGLDRSRMREEIRQQVWHFLSLFSGPKQEKVDIDNRRGVMPTLLLHDQQIHLSFSHASTISCAALSFDTEIGVDLIDLDDIKSSDDLLSTAQLFLPPSVANSLQDYPDQALRFHFAMEWAKREASLKCLGLPLVEWTENDPSLFCEIAVEFISMQSRYVIALARLVAEN